MQSQPLSQSPLKVQSDRPLLPADQSSERRRDVPLVRPKISQQPAHEARIVGFAEDLFFVERHIRT